MLLLSIVFALLWIYAFPNDKNRFASLAEAASRQLGSTETAEATALGRFLLWVLLVAGLAWLLALSATLLSLAFGTLCLVVCLQQLPASAKVAQYATAADQHNWQAAVDEARALGAATDELETGQWEHLHHRLLAAYSYHNLSRRFCVLGTFVLLGPVGAIIYRCLLEWPDTTASAQLRKLFEWPWIRALGLTYALTGYFSGAIAVWQRHLLSTDAHPAVIYQLSLAALSPQNPPSPFSPVSTALLQEAVLLNRRSLWCWLGLLALVTLLT
jgi:AmpE protein